MNERFRIWLPRTILIAAVVVQILFSVGALNNKPNDYDDGLAYVSLAKSLSEGKEYRNYAEPGAPKERGYPWVHPFVLSLSIRFFGESLVPMKIAESALALGTTLASYLIFRFALAPLGASVISLSLAVSPYVLLNAQKLLSETTYIFFSLLCFLLWFMRTRAASDRHKILLSCALGLSVAATMLTRKIGIVLLPSVLLFFFLEAIRYPSLRRETARSLAAFLLSVALPLALWLRHDPGFGLISQVKLAAPLSTASTATQALAVPHFIRQGILYVQEMAYLVVPAFANLFLDFRWLVVPFILLTLLGFTVSVFRQFSPMEVYVALYSAVILSWPWNARRFAFAVLPLLFLYFVRGLEWTFVRLRVSPSKAVAAATVGLLALIQLPATLALTRQVRYGIDRFPPFAAHYEAGLEELKNRISPGAILWAPNPRLANFVTGAVTSGWYLPNDRREVLKQFRMMGITHFVYDHTYVRFQGRPPIHPADLLPECSHLLFESGSFQAFELRLHECL